MIKKRVALMTRFHLTRAILVRFHAHEVNAATLTPEATGQVIIGHKATLIFRVVQLG